MWTDETWCVKAGYLPAVSIFYNIFIPKALTLIALSHYPFLVPVVKVSRVSHVKEEKDSKETCTWQGGKRTRT